MPINLIYKHQTYTYVIAITYSLLQCKPSTLRQRLTSILCMIEVLSWREFTFRRQMRITAVTKKDRPTPRAIAACVWWTVFVKGAPAWQLRCALVNTHCQCWSFKYSGTISTSSAILFWSAQLHPVYLCVVT